MPLAIEPMHAASAGEWTFINDLAMALELVEEYQSPALKLSLDTYHFPLNASQLRLVERAARHVAVVHLADRRHPPTPDQERCPLGCGLLPLSDIVQTLQDGGFLGWYDVKLIGPEIESVEYWTLLEDAFAAVADLTGAAARTLA